MYFPKTIKFYFIVLKFQYIFFFNSLLFNFNIYININYIISGEFTKFPFILFYI